MKKQGKEGFRMGTPLIKTLEMLKKSSPVSFHTPGHKSGKAFESLGDGGLRENLYPYDTTEIFATDQLQNPSGVLKESQQWTAKVFKSSEAYYLINGSSGGVLSMILSQTKPGDEVLLSRDVHQSVIHALILGDLTPRFISQEIDPLYKIPMGITAKNVKEGLLKYPNCKGVLVTHPNYYGRASELLEIRNLTRSRRQILWVDQAHGAHLGLHPQLPLSGIDAGADLTVMSFHKTLPAMTQCGVLFVSGGLVDRDRLQEQLNIHQSSSPSYILMASIEQGTRHYLEAGREKMKDLLRGIDQFEQRFQQLKLFQLDACPGKDRTKLWIRTENSGLAGGEVETRLRENHGIIMELSMPQGVLALTSIGNGEKDLEKLYLAFEELEKTLYNKIKMEKFPEKTSMEVFVSPGENAGDNAGEKDSLALPIRTAFYRPKERVLINKSINRVAGSTLTPYPPGIPLILPGERITGQLISRLSAYQQSGHQVSGIKEGKIMVVTEE